ncbi:MAG: sigma-70 family RNA polymerase sigma factor [Elusimicrobiota bacterium]
MKTTEAALIAASKGGDVSAFDALIRRYEDKIFRLAHSVCAGLPSEAEDVYQETFLTAFKGIRRFRGESGLGTWLYRIASNLCWMRLRKKKRQPFVEILDRPHRHGTEGPVHQFQDWAASPEEEAKKRELREAVAKALSELPVDYRLVLTLRDIERLSNKETAKVLKLSVAAVKTRIHRGRLFLREKLDGYFRGKG